MLEQDKLYGTTTIGSKGQVVIPVEARKDLQLKPGDQLVVMGKFGKALGLMKAEDLAGFIKMIMNHMAGSPMENKVREHISKVFGDLKSPKK